MRILVHSVMVCFLATNAFGQSPQGTDPNEPFRPPLDPLSLKLDANNDGELSTEELSKAPAVLQALDLNKDGKLTIEELLPGFQERRPGFGRPDTMGAGRGPNRVEQKLTEKHDADKNGYLDPIERQKALAEVQIFGGGGGRPGGRPGGPAAQSGSTGPKVSPNDVKNFPDLSLYDSTILRTIFIEFDTDTWEDEMAKFKNTDVEMPATVIVDGTEYPLVGVKFRGQSSFGHVPAGSKRSLNLSMDLIDGDQKLYGYKTLNLLNCNGDASFLSSILFSQLASDYLPTPKANMVKVVINGESWGIYSNVQQFNKDFLKEFYGTTAGARWKVAGSPQADGGLRYLGDDIAPYRQRFEIKSRDDDDSWNALIHLCKVLNETPIENLPTALEPLLNVDGVLRFLAIDVTVVNSDGYWTRASDYSIYLDPRGTFHILPHDMNESFRGGGPKGEGFPGPPPEQLGAPADGLPPGGQFGRPQGFGRPGGRGPGGPGHGGPTLDPLVGLDSERMPLRSRLLAVPQYRKLYLQYLRTIAEKNLAHKNLTPLIAHYRNLVDSEVQIDTRKMLSYDAFANATAPLQNNQAAAPGSINEFIGQRRDFLLKHEEISAVAVLDIKRPTILRPRVVEGDTGVKVAISEFLASNKRTNKDPQGEFEDWIELVNYDSTDVDLSGMFLTDDDDDLYKWKIPANTIIKAGGYLIIWADEDGGDEGLHANFKLSKDGESIILTNQDVIVDRLKYGPQISEVSTGRIAGDNGEMKKLRPTPASPNRLID
ncbi:MAG: hypothetical protein HN882_15475 [Planctomycetaceae bacterium]|nr:hypothetical protein [Planctomycetaceae bacterium]